MIKCLTKTECCDVRGCWQGALRNWGSGITPRTGTYSRSIKVLILSPLDVFLISQCAWLQGSGDRLVLTAKYKAAVNERHFHIQHTLRSASYFI
jgi:hypothetical protein